jgi:hypothetical protein
MHCIKTNVLNEETDSKCQLYNEHGEAIDHLTTGCPIVANNEYLMRHDKVCAHLHCSICRTLGNEMRDKWHTHTHPNPSQCMNRNSVVESSITHRQRNYSKQARYNN